MTSEGLGIQDLELCRKKCIFDYKMNGARSETKREWAILDGMAIPSGFGENELLAYILTV